MEIDPWDPKSTPIKRTALGRTKHEGATMVVGDDNTVAVYSGDDERNDYAYKFVCEQKLNRHNPKANRNLLDKGTLHVAKFNNDGTGQWIPLLPGTLGVDGAALRDNPNFVGANDDEVLALILIKTRMAADAVGATMMDRPEWVTVHPTTGEVYMTLTNNSRRGNTQASSNEPDGSSTAASTNPPVDAANPRPDNDYGHIIRWNEDGGKVGATTFKWNIFVQCGDKKNDMLKTPKVLNSSYNKANMIGVDLADPNFNKKIYAGNIVGDDYGAPDGVWIDKDGRLWIETDQGGDAKGDWANIGGNMLLCADIATGKTKRFMTAVPYSEVTGVITTPDGKTMFVGIQHPGEDWSGRFTDNSTWPDSGKNDGGVIGT